MFRGSAIVTTVSIAALAAAAPATAGKREALCCAVDYVGKQGVVITGVLKLPKKARFLYAPGCNAKAADNRVTVELKGTRSDFERGWMRIDYVIKHRGEVRYKRSARFWVRGTAEPAPAA